MRGTAALGPYRRLRKVWPLSRKAVPVLRDFPRGRTARTRVTVVVALSAALLAAAFTVPGPSSASSGDQHAITHRKTQLEHQIAGSHQDLDEISHRLVEAQGRLDSATADLAAARATLEGLQNQVAQATLRDQRMQQALEAARRRLAGAKADFAQGRRTALSQRDDLAAYAVASSSAQLSQLSTLSLLFNADSTQAAISQVQSANSALDKQVTDLQRLQANQVLLRFTEQRIQTATDQVAVDRRRAAANLATKQRLETAAAEAAGAVEQQVADLQVQQSSLAAAKSVELGRIRTMDRERAHLEQRLKRIAAARAAAAAREAAAERSAATSSAGSTTASTLSSSSGFLSWPVKNTYITSPYGMRMHPILHIWKLHDGTDFHALCGTPVYAAADGRVLSEYYNTATETESSSIMGMSTGSAWRRRTTTSPRLSLIQVSR